MQARTQATVQAKMPPAKRVFVMSDPKPPASPLFGAGTLDAVLRRHILTTCEICNWRMVLVAERLGCSLKTVYNRLDQYEAEGWVRRDAVTGRWVRRQDEFEGGAGI